MTAKAQIKPREKTFNITNFIFYAGAAAIGAALKIFYDTAGNDSDSTPEYPTKTK